MSQNLNERVSVGFHFKVNQGVIDAEKALKEISEKLAKSNRGKLNLHIEIDDTKALEQIGKLKQDLESIKNIKIDLNSMLTKPGKNGNLKAQKLDKSVKEDVESTKKEIKETVKYFNQYSSLLNSVQKKREKIDSEQRSLRSKGIKSPLVDQSAKEIKAIETQLDGMVKYYDTLLKKFNGRDLSHVTSAQLKQYEKNKNDFIHRFGGSNAQSSEIIQRATNKINELANNVSTKEQIPSKQHKQILSEQKTYNDLLKKSESNLRELIKTKQLFVEAGSSTGQIKHIQNLIDNTNKLQDELRIACNYYEQMDIMARKGYTSRQDRAKLKDRTFEFDEIRNRHGVNVNASVHAEQLKSSLSNDLTDAKIAQSAFKAEQKIAQSSEKMHNKELKEALSNYKAYNSLLNQIKSKKESLNTQQNLLKMDGFESADIKEAILQLDDFEQRIKSIISNYDYLLKKLNGESLANFKQLDVDKNALTEKSFINEYGGKHSSSKEAIARIKNEVNNLSKDVLKDNKTSSSLINNYKIYSDLATQSDVEMGKVRKLKETLESLKKIDFPNINEVFPNVDTTILDVEKLNKELHNTARYYELLAKQQSKSSFLGNGENLSNADLDELKQLEETFKSSDYVAKKYNTNQTKTNFQNILKSSIKDIDVFQKKADLLPELNPAESFTNYQTVLHKMSSELERIISLRSKLTSDNSFIPSLDKSIQELQHFKSEYENFIKYKTYQQENLKGIDDKDSILGDMDIKNRNHFLEQARAKEATFLAEEAKSINPMDYSDRSLYNLEKIIKSFDAGYKAAKKYNTELTKINNLSMKASSYASKFEVNLKKVGQYGNFTDFINKVDAGYFTNFDDALSQLRDLQTAARKAGVETETFGSMFSKTFGSRIRSAMAGMGTFFITDSFRAMFQNVKNLDSAMTELKKVTDETGATYNQFMVDAQQRSKDIGTGLSDTINATADFARLGYDLPDASKLADSANVYYHVGDDIQSIDDATSSLISTMKGFGIEAENSMDIVDMFNEVSNNFATSSGDIGEGLKRSSAAMAAAGNTIEETIGLFTGAQTVVQDADVVGTAQKTMSMRLRASKTDMEEAGLDTEGMATSVSKLRDEIKSLSGVDLMVDNENFKSTYAMLEDLSKVWDDLSDINRANILELLFGKRQANIGAAILENFDIVKKATETAKNSKGSATKENEKIKKSIQGRLNTLKAELEGFSWNILNDDAVKTTISGLNTIINLASKLVDITGAEGVALATVFAVMNHNDPTKGIFKVVDTIDKDGFLTKKADFKFDKRVLNVDAFKKAVKSADDFHGKLKAIKNDFKNGNLFDILPGADSKKKAFDYSETIKRNEKTISNAKELARLEAELFKIDQIPTEKLTSKNVIARENFTTQLGNVTSKSSLESLRLVEDAKKHIGDFPDVDQWLKNTTDKITTFGDTLAKEATVGIKSYISVLKEEVSSLINDYAVLRDYDTKLSNTNLSDEERDSIKNKRKNQSDIIERKTRNYLPEATAMAEEYHRSYDEMKKDDESFTQFANRNSQERIQEIKANAGEAGKTFKGLSSTFAAGAKSLLGNIGAGLVIGTGIELAMTGLSKLNDKFNITSSAKIEDMNKVVSNYNEATQAATDNIEKINSVKSDFNELSKGVDDKTGENIGLTTEDFEKYHQIVDELIAINPDIIEGYDAQGRAIVKKNEAIKESIELQKEANEMATREYLNGGKELFEGVQSEYKDDLKSKNDSLSDIREIFASSEQVRQEFKAAYGKDSNLLDSEDFIKNGDEIVNILHEIHAVSDDEVSSLKDNISEFSDSYDKVKSETKDLYEWLKLYAYSDLRTEKGERVETLGLSNFLSPELKDSFDGYLQELATRSDLTFDGMKSKVAEFGAELLKVNNDTDFKTPLLQLRNAKEVLDRSNWSSEDIEKYNNTVAEATEQLQNFASQHQGNTVIAQEVRDAINEVADSYGRLTKELSVEAVLSLDDSGLESARTQLEQFQQIAGKADYTNAIKDFGTIYKTIIDKVDGEGRAFENGESSLHSLGKGDQTFWDGAERILGAKKLKEINYNVDKAKKLMKEYKSAFQGGAKAVGTLFDKLGGNSKQTIKELNKILGYDAFSLRKNGDLDIDYIDPSRYGELADYLGMSEDLFVALLDNARQFSDISFTNIQQLAHAIKQSGETVEYMGKTYSSYSNFEATAKKEGHTPADIQHMFEQLKKENIILVDADKIGTLNSFLAGYQKKTNKNFYDTKNKTITNPNQYIKALSNVLKPDEIINAWRTAEQNGYKFDISQKDLNKYDLSEDGDQGKNRLEGVELENYIHDHLNQTPPEEVANDPVNAIDNQTNIIASKLDDLILLSGGDPEHDQDDQIKSAKSAVELLLGDGNGKTGNVHNEAASNILDNSLKTMNERYNQMKDSYLKQENGEYKLDVALNDENTGIAKLKAEIDKLTKEQFTVKLQTQVEGVGDARSKKLLETFETLGVDNEKMVEIMAEYSENGDSEQFRELIDDLPEEVQTVVKAIIKGDQELKYVDGKIFEIDGKKATCIFSANASDYKKQYKFINNKLYEIDGKKATCIFSANAKDYKKQYKFINNKLYEIDGKKATCIFSANTKDYKKQYRFINNKLYEIDGKKATCIFSANTKDYKKKYKFINKKLYEIDGKKATCIYSANAKDIGKKYSYTKGKLKDLSKSSSTSNIKGNNSNFKNKKKQTEDDLTTLNGKSAEVSIIARFKGFVGDAWTYVKEKLGLSSANGTPGRISPSYANGTPKHISPSYAKGRKNFGAKGGLSLTGELGPELIWSGDHSYLVGERGPEMVKLKPGDVVYTADETKRILAGRNLHTKFGSHFGGTIHKENTTETETTTKVTKKKKHTVTTTKKTHKTHTNNKPSKKNTPKKNTPKKNTPTKEKDKRLKKFEAGQNRLDHLLQMGFISEKTYYTRLQRLYNKYLKGVKKFVKERRQAQEDIHSHMIAAYENEKSILDYNLQMGFISQKTYYERLVALKDKYLKKNKGFAKERRAALLEEKDTLLAVYEKEKSDLQHKLAMNQINYATYYKNLKNLDNKYLKGKKKFTEEYKKQLEEEKNAHNDAYNAASEYVDYLYNTGRITDDERLKRQENLYKKYYPKLGKGVYKYESRQEAEKLLGIANENYSKDVSDLNEKFEKGLITIDEYFLSINKLTDKYKKYKNGMKDAIEDTAEDALDTIGSKFDEKLSDLQQLISDKDLFHAWKNDESPIIYYQNLTKEIDRAFTLGMISADKYKDLIEEINRVIKQTQDADFTKQHEQLNSMVDLVEQLVRQEAQDQIDALNKQSEVYNKIVDQKRKSLELTEKELSFQENMEDIATQIAEKQNEINLLSRDDSRSGKAKLSEAQKELKELLKNQEHALREETTHKINERYDESIEQHSALIERHVKSISDWLDDKAAVLDKVFEEIDNKGTNDLLARLLLYNQQHGDGFDVTVLNYWKDLQEVLKFKTGPVKDILLELKRLTDVDHIKNGIVPPPNQSVTKRHNGLSGGYIGDNVTPKMNETYALLTRDELVLNRQDQDMLAAKLKHGEAYKDLMESISKTSGISHASNVRTSQNTDIKIENNIQINSTGDLPSDIDKIGEQLSNKTLSKLQNALQINGVRPNININTYNRN